MVPLSMVFSRFFAAYKCSLIFGMLSIFVGFADMAQAGTVTITGAPRSSNFTAGATATDVPIIYGGIAGTDCAVSPGTSAFCNSCAEGTGATACNEKRIHPDLVLRIEFTVTTETAGTIVFGKVDGGVYTPFTYSSPGNIYTKSTTGTLKKGDIGYVEITWGNLCYQLTTDSNCATISADTNIFIAVDSNATVSADDATTASVKIFQPTANTGTINSIECGDDNDGICSFIAYPGDEKVYVDEVEPGGSYPTVSSVPVIGVRFFYVDSVTFPGGDTTSINYQSPHADLSIDAEGAPDPNKITGLTNDIFYGFKVATIDAAYNIAYLTSDAQINSECTANSLDPTGDDNCVYVAKPSNVLGLLPEDVNCFISTAAYGSSMAAKVQTFRNFRNRILLPNKIGLKLVKAYYTFGPQAAQFIIDYPALKPFARMTLWPLWAFATLSLKWGFGFTSFAFLMASLGISAVIIWGIIKCAPTMRSV
jgi:hypothetical protein